MMKVYLVLLALSTVGIVLHFISAELIMYKHFKRVYRSPIHIVIFSWVRTLILNFFIVPGLIVLLLHIFNYSAMESAMMKEFEKSEKWIKKG